MKLCWVVLPLLLPGVSLAETLSESGLAVSYARESNTSTAVAKEQVHRLFAAIRGELLKGNEILIQDFGRFYLSEREIKPRLNPRTKNARNTRSPLIRRYARFSPSPSLRLALNRKSARIGK